MNQDLDFGLLGFRTKEEFTFPNIINIEVYRGYCPCSCVHCPIGITEPTNRKRHFGERSIELALYKKLIAEISQHPHSTVRVHSVGEPLIWNDLIEALRFTHDSAVRSWVFTSAVTRNIDLLKAICKYTDIVEVSVNSKTSDDYRVTKGVNAFPLVSENIKRMHDCIKDNNLATRLLASRVETVEKDTDDAFVKHWKSSGFVDDAFVRSHHTYNATIPALCQSKAHTHKACVVHWARFNISADGYAVVCFNELFKKPTVDFSLILGDLREQSVADIWHGPKLTAIRRAELSGDYDAILSGGTSLPCKDCYSCQPLSGDRQASEYQVRQLKDHKYA